MKKHLAFLTVLLLLSRFIFSAPSDDLVSEIQEEGKQFRQGQYKAGTDIKNESGPETQKGTGFDEITAPEILIKGKVDTRITAVRELNSMYDTEKLRGILFEKNKVELPGGIDEGSRFSPLGEKATIERENAFWLKIFGGTASTFLAECLYGKSLSGNDSFVLNAGHESYDNPRQNAVDTRRMMNFFSAYYGASYGRLTAFYSLKAGYDSYGNPYPENIFGRSNDMSSADFKGRFGYFNGEINYSGTLSYSYFDSYAKETGIYGHSLPAFEIKAKKDFSLESSAKASASASVYWQGGVYKSTGETKNGNYVLKFNAFGSYSSDLYILKAGIEGVSFFFGTPVFRVAPKIYASYEPWSFITIYGRFTPETSAPLLADTIKEMPFTIVPDKVKGTFDDIDARAGIGLNFFEMFLDLYAGVKKTVIRTVNTAMNPGICTLTDSPSSYTSFGMSVNALRIKGFGLKAGYEYRILDKEDYSAPLMLPLQIIYSAISFEVSGLRTDINISGENEKYAASGVKIPAYLDLGITATYDINSNISVFLKANNLLNNPEYMVYYYKNKGLNLGLGAVINF